jgi:hypothetical protein
MVEADPDGDGPMGFATTDAVRTTVVGVNLTAYNGGSDLDNGENDLIEVVLRRNLTTMNFRLQRTNDSIMVWTTSNKGTSITFVNAGGLESDNLSFASGAQEMTVWVEWVGPGHGTVDLSVKESISGRVLDTVKFHTFHSIVIALGGEDQVPADPPDANHGTFQVAVDLYRRGYDVWMFDEDEVNTTGAGAVYNEVVRAIEGRFVTQVAVFGYSHGGGSTFLLCRNLNDNRANISGTFDIVFTSYVDAVEDENGEMDMFQEQRRPPSSLYHMNQYQHGTLGDGWLDGGPILAPDTADWELDVETTAWGANATHYDVDDFVQVRNEILARLQPRVQR